MRSLAIFLALLASNAIAAEKIPLDEIWGYNLPETQDVRKLEPKRKKPVRSAEELVKSSPTQQIQRLLTDRPKERKSGFVVEGSGKEALEKAKAVFLMRGEKGKRLDRQPGLVVEPDTEVSLVFFTYAIGDSAVIESVERADNIVTVKYQLVPRMTQDVKVHFALIPLGEFSEGVGRVNIKQVPTNDSKGEPITFKSRSYVCDSFSFGVKQ